MRWANESGALYVDGGLKLGYQYQITSADTDPAEDDLRGATVDNAPNPAYYALPKSLPSEVRDLAQQITAGSPTPYDKALAIKNYFRANFKYSLTVQRGHSNDAMLNFLSIKKLANANSAITWWKVGVPLLTIFVLAVVSFQTSNFTAADGFNPYGARGIL